MLRYWFLVKIGFIFISVDAVAYYCLIIVALSILLFSRKNKGHKLMNPYGNLNL